MIRKESIRIFLAIFCLLELLVDQIDIVEAYLSNLLTDNDRSIFMKLLLEMKFFRAIKEKLIVYLL